MAQGSQNATVDAVVIIGSRAGGGRENQMIGKSIAWLAVVGTLVLWLSGPLVPGWLVVIAVVAAIPLGFSASAKQKRMERDWMRAGWRSLTKRT